MIRWNKILTNRSKKITKTNKSKNFKDFAEELGGYNSNENYENKNSFFKFYLNGHSLNLNLMNISKFKSTEQSLNLNLFR